MGGNKIILSQLSNTPITPRTPQLSQLPINQPRHQFLATIMYAYPEMKREQTRMHTQIKEEDSKRTRCACCGGIILIIVLIAGGAISVLYALDCFSPSAKVELKKHSKKKSPPSPQNTHRGKSEPRGYIYESATF